MHIPALLICLCLPIAAVAQDCQKMYESARLMVEKDSVQLAVLKINALRTCLKRFPSAENERLEKLADGLSVRLFLRIDSARKAAVEQKIKADKATAAEKLARGEAERQSGIATRNASVSKSKSLASQSYNELLTSNIQLSALLAIGADDERPIPEAKGALLRLFYGDRPLPDRIIDVDTIVTAIKGAPRGNLFASGCKNGKILIWDMADLEKPRYVLEGPRFSVNRLCFDASGNILAAAYEGGDSAKILLWNLQTRKPIGEPLSFNGHLRSMDMSRDGRKLVTVGGRIMAEMRLWNVTPFVQTGREIAMGQAGFACFNPAGTMIGST